MQLLHLPVFMLSIHSALYHTFMENYVQLVFCLQDLDIFDSHIVFVYNDYIPVLTPDVSWDGRGVALSLLRLPGPNVHPGTSR